MKKLIIRIICVALSLLLLTTSVGCKKEEVTIKDDSITRTDILLYVGGTSDYKVVIPENATDYETFAKDELVTFFKEATGYEFEVIKDTGLAFDQNACYISLGKTKIYEGSGVDASYDQLGRDGYKLVRKGKTLIICGGDGYGTVNGVYDFLENTVDWHAWAPDEITFTKSYRLYMLDFNKTENPDFENRSGGYYVTYNNKIFATRSRVLSGPYNRLFEKSGIWGSWAHTTFGYLPPNEYSDLHSDWYNSDLSQLCLSNMEMRDEMFVKIKERILETDSELFMIGQEDVNSFCECHNCKIVTNEIGASGLMMQFINDMARRVKTWQAETCPERKIKLGTFAYQKTQEPPVVQDENGKYTLLDKNLKAEDNVFVCIAPIYADWSTPINDPNHNAISKIMIEGWQVVSNDLMVWSYCNNFNMCLEYFDNINVIATNYKIFRDAGVSFLFDESGGTTKQNFMFQTMMGYIHAELMWDCEQNVETLITDFMNAYYKEAAESMKKLFDLMRYYVTARKVEMGKEDNTHYGTGIWRADEDKTLLNENFWKKSVLDQMLAYVDEAYALIENSSRTPEYKANLISRVKIESLTPRLYLLHLFGADINKQLYFEMINEFESDMSEFGIPNVFSKQSTSETMAEWRSNKI